MTTVHTHLDRAIGEALALLVLVLVLVLVLDSDDAGTAVNARVVESGLRKAAARPGAVQAAPWAEARAQLSALWVQATFLPPLRLPKLTSAAHFTGTKNAVRQGGRPHGALSCAFFRGYGGRY